MTRIEELLLTAQGGQPASRPEFDPLTERDALQESQLIDVWVHAVASTVALVFEFRTALHFDETNTGLMVARGLRDFSWSGESRATGMTAWNIVGSAPT